jgi:molecular chaperone DnaK (HSP70)
MLQLKHMHQVRAIENTEGARTTPSIVAKHQNGNQMIGVMVSLPLL